MSHSVGFHRSLPVAPGLKALSAVLLIATMCITFAVRAAVAEFDNVARVVAVGDLHGDYEQYLAILQQNNLINERLKWSGGETHFVQLGDVTDRGPDSLKIIRHLQKLEKQARKKGGRVHVLIGNHEAMNIQTDLRYVHPGEYQALVTSRSDKLRERYLDAVFQAVVNQSPTPVSKPEQEMARLKALYPLGYVEHRQLWEPGRELARWYAKQNTVIRINDSLYLHGGLNPHAASYPSLEAINRTISRELESGERNGLSTQPDGPLWYRGLAVHEASEELEPLKAMLEFYGAEHIVIGHTPTGGAILPRFDRRVIRADVGISSWYNQALANVLQEDGELYAMHRGEQFVLPDDKGVDAYVGSVLELEAADSRMVRCINKRKEAVETLEAAAGFACKW